MNFIKKLRGYHVEFVLYMIVLIIAIIVVIKFQQVDNKNEQK